MTTRVEVVNDTVYTAVLLGPGVITLEESGMVKVHVGTVLPAVTTTAFHPLAHGIDHQYSYSGSETTWMLNDGTGDCNVVVTPLL